ncbi:MAG: acyltransferase [Halieaceae bacterium]|jgi:1-acyl-sn-glycerol-3-phosphate acyltransferase|nr:acyltransferase [Halieaceae bacterium]
MKKWLGNLVLRLGGWRIEGERPIARSYVLIAAPHTSSWDFPYMLAFAAVFDIKISWLGKHTLFWGPLGWIMRALGGVPIIRHKNRDVVGAMVDTFKANPNLVLLIPTEGTRSRREYWKSGFYHIAHSAGVPIIPSYLDYKLRRGGFGPALETTGNAVADMQYFRNFYTPMEGKYAERFGPVRLREEGEEP